ncbi:hypothetical protein [Paenibacillus ginsengihumi]|uniref:hypothetical protein n=1 Tax=Paenibacillus ginsengihumi TaxID=431596 RepID=UPI000379F4B2|nr:hypothetical protein [Paenibacillus ginsengihumi]
MSKKAEQAVEKSALKAEPAYTKEQFLSSKRFTAIQRDVLAAVLEDGKTYTNFQAKQALEAYLRKELT